MTDVQSTVPGRPGDVIPWRGPTVPRNCIPMDGRTLSVREYPDLFLALRVDEEQFPIPDEPGYVMVVYPGHINGES